MAQQDLDAQTLPTVDMDVDGDEYVVDPAESEKEDVMILTPEDVPDQVESVLMADNYDEMKKLALPILPDQPETVDEVVYTWNIEGWSQLPRKAHSPVFQAGGQPWRILMFPTGNQPDCCSFYLEHGYPQAEIPPDWYSCVQFGLVLWNPRDPSHYVEHHAHHRFTEVEGDWGFTRFEELRKLFNAPRNGSGRPMVENDGANLTAYVRVVKDETGVLWHTFNNYDSKKETGFVGLRNQGATCYLNSLIQSLYFTNAFRKAVYQIPTENDATLSNSAYTLQRLFYQLQTSQTAVSTTELTKSFGWETRHIFEQQDVQELSRKLMERLEEKMKGTVAENVLPSLFCGKVKTYISCINVKYESSRVEDFWDIQLNVSGNKDIIASFQDYIQVEKMDGENQYYAGEEFKLQDANKGVIFQSFPDVLHLQLKRFEYDFERDAMMKINDRYEYPETFDAAPYLSEDSGTSEPYTYQLHGVLVHSGDLNAGHYYAFIKPTKDGHFYRYDDDRVTRATMREVLEENYGGYYQQANGLAKPGLQKPVIRQNSAYMLVYIRQSRLDKVLTPVTQDDVPIHLQKRLQEEAAIAEAQRKEREERHLYMNVRVVTEQTFKEYHGTDLASWDNPEKDPGAARTYRVLKASTVQDLVDEVANDLEKDPKHVRFWIMVNRQNKTTRPDQPITNVAQTMEQCVQSHSAKSSQEYRLWAEVAENIGEDGEPQWPALSNTQGNQAQPKGDNILLLLKWFDVEHQILRGIGHIYMGRERKVEDLVPPILQKMGWPEKQPNGDKTQIQLYEEIKPQMVDVIKPKQSLRSAELQDGDIICFQKLMDHKSAAHESDKDPKTGKPLAGLVASITKGHHGSQSANGTARPMNWMEDAQQFYDYLLYRKVVHFMPHPRSSAEQAPPFDLELSIKYTYDQLAARVAEHLGCDPTHLRFHTVALVNGNPKTPLKRNINATLQSILNPPYNTFNTNNQRNNELYFEVLEMSLSELDMKKNLRVVWLTEGVTKEESYDVLVPKNGNVRDLIAGLIKRAHIEQTDEDGPIVVYAVHNNRIYRELDLDYAVISISDVTALVAQRIPPEEAAADASELIQVFHFQGEPSKSHGYPFRFLLKKGEKFSETKKRLEKRSGIKGKNFEKIKFAIVRRSSYSKPTYLTDDNILWDDAEGDDLLGMEHMDRSRVARNGVGDLFLR